MVSIMKAKILKVSNKFKIKLDPFYSTDLECWQLSLPHLSLYKSKATVCVVVNLMLFDIQFWFGDVTELV